MENYVYMIFKNTFDMMYVVFETEELAKEYLENLKTILPEAKYYHIEQVHFIGKEK